MLMKGRSFMRKRYLIEINKNDRLVVSCPAHLMKDRSLKRIAFGSKSMEVEFVALSDNTHRIILSKKISETLLFPDLGTPLHVFFENQTLYIGPLIGIFTAGFTSFPFRPIGERSAFFAKLLSVKKTVGVLPFVFGEQHIDWERGIIQGYFFHEHEWKVIDVPFPNVIYDRLPNRKSERNPALKTVKERLQKDYLIPWYNPGFFNKLDIYERLQQEARAAPYLPETHPFSSFSTIERMLSDYGHIYLKPFNGSLGLGVHQIIYDKHQNDYFCRYRDHEGVNRLRRFPSLESLFRAVFSRHKLDKILVQQGIHLIRYDQRIIDFRVHTNKDDQGEWRVTALAAKIAGTGSVTTHVRSGGEVKTLEEIFSGEQSTQYKEMLTDAALKLSKALEKNMEGIIGEIGFDLGIDRNGDVWLFEANSKPGRSIFKHPELKEFDLLTRKLSMSFAIFLTEQASLYPEDIYK
jgi:hypothetical protein